MPWVRLDDAFPEHPKIARLGDSALALFVVGLAYCNRNLTDGFIPNQVGLGQLRFCDGNVIPAIRELEDAGCWDKVDGGWFVHDYFDYQPSKEDVLKERARERTKKRKQRSSPKESRKVSPGDSPRDNGGDPHGNPAAPVPVPNPVPEPVSKNGHGLRGEAELGFERADAIARLLAVLTDKDAGTEKRVWFYAAKLPAPTIHKVRESVLENRATIRSSVSGFAVNALKDEAKELA